MKILMEKQYSLKEVCKEIFVSGYWDQVYGVQFSNYVLSMISDLYQDGSPVDKTLNFITQDENDDFIYLDFVDKMLDEFYNRFYKYNAIAVYDDSEKEEAINEFITRFLNVLNVTYPKYATIIKFYTNNEAKLMDALNRDYTDDADSSGTVVNRYNDTPQDGGAFEDDNHTTNINESTSSSDSGLEHKETYNNEYMLDRLNRIRDNLSNIYTEWENKVATILWR